MRSEWSKDKLLGVWYTLKSQLGDFQSIVKTRREELPNYQVIIVTCRFSITWDIRVAFDSQGRVGGLFFTPPKTQVTANERTSCPVLPIPYESNHLAEILASPFNADHNH